MKVSPGKGKRWSRLDLRGNRVGVGRGRGGCLTRERKEGGASKVQQGTGRRGETVKCSGLAEEEEMLMGAVFDDKRSLPLDA